MAGQRYDELDPKVREFLSDLDEDGIDELREAIHFMRATKTVSRFLKWCIITFVAAVLAAASFGDAIEKIWGWFTSWRTP